MQPNFGCNVCNDDLVDTVISLGEAGGECNEGGRQRFPTGIRSISVLKHVGYSALVFQLRGPTTEANKLLYGSVIFSFRPILSNFSSIGSIYNVRHHIRKSLPESLTFLNNAKRRTAVEIMWYF